MSLNPYSIARRLRLSLKCIQKLSNVMRAPGVAGLRVGKLWRFRASDLDRCLPIKVSSEQLSVPSHHP